MTKKKNQKALRAAGPRRAPREHPEDRAARLEGEAYGRAYAAEFCAEHAVAFRRMIGVYADNRAQAILDTLREQFWARIWRPSLAPSSACPTSTKAGPNE